MTIAGSPRIGCEHALVAVEDNMVTLTDLGSANDLRLAYLYLA